MKLKKRLPIIFAMAAIMALTAAVPVNATAPKKESVEYKGSGKVEVEFLSKVKYKRTSVTVKDTSGKKYKASITEKDSDDMDFRVKNYKAGKTYKFTIKGVKAKGTSKYGKVTGTFKIPAASTALKVKKVEYKGNGKVEVDFRSKVCYKGTAVAVTDAAGKAYIVRILEKDNDDIEFAVKNYTPGETYNFTISGLKMKGASKYSSVSGSFSIPAEAIVIPASVAYDNAVADAVAVYGIDGSTVTLLENKLDYENGVKVYDIEFTAYQNGVLVELEYDVDAVAGTFVKKDCEVYGM